MSDIQIAIQDYKIIKQALLKLKPGLTMIVSDNGTGKSTSIKAMKTLVDGTYGESSNVRHGKEGYAIAVKIDGTKVRVARRGKDTFLKFQDEGEVSKLGRGSLSKLEPRFPLKRVDYLDSSFYPNFCFQNDIPLFNDISVFDLFSSMFQDVARVAQRVDSLRKDAVNLSRNVQDLEANVSYQTSETSKAEQLWQQFQQQYPHLQEEYQTADSAYQLEQHIAQLRLAQTTAASGLDLPAMESATAQLAVAQELFPLYDKVQEVKPKVERVHQLRKALSVLKTPVYFDSFLIEKGYRTNQLRNQTKELCSKLNSFPNTSLISDVLLYKEKLEELSRVNLDLNDIKTQYNELFEQVKKEGCPFAVQGVCPKM